MGVAAIRSISMSSAAVPLAQKVEERIRRDPGFQKVLDALLEAPTTPHGTLEHLAARTLNNQRRVGLVRDFVEDALPTRRVQGLLRLGSPQAVHRLRTRSKLIGSAVGNQTWFPAWQFDEDRLRPDLPRILELIARFTADPFAADRLMRTTHDQLDGASIAEALRRPDLEGTAWRMLAAAGA